MNRAIAAFSLLVLAALAPAQGDSESKVRVKKAVFDRDAVVIDLRIEPKWHIYAITSEYDAGNLTKVAVEKPAEIAGPVGEPKPKHKKKDYLDDQTKAVIYTEEYDYHEGEITLRIPVKGVSGPAVKGTLTVTACDADRCLQPGKVKFTAEAAGGATPTKQAPESVPTAPDSRTESRPRKVVQNPPRRDPKPSDPFQVLEISYPDPVTTECFDVRVVARIADGYHVYGLKEPSPGVLTEVKFPKPDAKDAPVIIALSGEVKADKPPKRRAKPPENYEYFDGQVTFIVPVRAMWSPVSEANRSADVPFTFRLAVDYQTCTWDQCLIPADPEFDLQATVSGGPHVLQVFDPTAVANGGGGTEVPKVPLVESEVSFEPTPLEPNERATMLVRLKRKDGKPLVADGLEPKIELGQAQHITVTGLASASPEPDGSVLIRLPIEVSAEAPDTSVPITGRATFGEYSAQFNSQVTIFAPLMGFLIIAALSALGALLTPCVFPMIPVTVSIFTKQAEAGAQHPAKLGILYCVGIIASFTAIGGIFTAVLSGDAANVFAQHWITQLVIAALFVFFALSLLGMFDLAVPQSVLNIVERHTTTRLVSSSEGKGASLTVLLMGLLFAITTFTCTAPFIGGLLAGASAGGFRKPILGMVAFSTVLAIPFFFLAVFPSQLKKLPKSGGWLNETKVVMGFIELAAAVKFINGADLSLGWDVFTRNVCLAMWIAIFGLTGLYLLGVFRLPKDMPRQKTSVLAMLLAGAFLTIAIYLSAGLNGRPLGKFIEAWLPPVEKEFEHEMGEGTERPGAHEGRTGYHKRFTDDYEAALKEAKKLDKPLFIDFTGFT